MESVADQRLAPVRLSGPAVLARCHETIYQAVYNGSRGGLSRTLTKRLRTGRPLRKRRRRPQERLPRFITPGRLIDQRPPAVESRCRLGDWEGDLITGRNNRSAIGTLVERRSRYVRLVHLPAGRSADELRNALADAVADLPESARRSVTWDQGSEMARHDEIGLLFADGVFFAYPGRPWQRACNENTNGLLRQYFPKRRDLAIHTPADLAAVEERLNNRPRKILWWRTPAQVVDAALRSCSTECCDGRSNSPWNPPSTGVNFRPALTAQFRFPERSGRAPHDCGTRGVRPSSH